MKQSDRRISIRKPLERLAYISLPFNNGGIVLDVSEGGVGFHAIAPVKADGPIHFRFAVDSARRIKAVGELAWTDETGKTGGLRFTELPDEIREYIRLWAGPAKLGAVEDSIAEPATLSDVALSSEAGLAPGAEIAPAERTVEAELEAASGNEIELAPAVDVPAVEPSVEHAAEANPDAGENFGWTPSWDVPVSEPVVDTEVSGSNEIDLAQADAGDRPLLYNLKPPVYSSPSYELSMFSASAESEARAAMAAQRGPFASRHPIAALVLTIFLASIVSSGIFAYVSTTQAGDVLYYLGEKVLEGFHPQPAPKSAVPPTNSAPDSSKTSQQ